VSPEPPKPANKMAPSGVTSNTIAATVVPPEPPELPNKMAPRGVTSNKMAATVVPPEPANKMALSCVLLYYEYKLYEL